MIPNTGCDPKINVVSIGAKVIQKIADGDESLSSLIGKFSDEMGVSQDHIIISLDWLFMINAISISGDRVIINEAR